MKILLPFDGSASALHAAALVAAYAGAAPEVTVLNVQALPAALFPEATGGLEVVEKALLEAGRAQLATALEKLKGARAMVRLGFAADVILGEASSATLVVMGMRGEGALHGFPIGSVALRVAHACPVPVMLVKADVRLPQALGRKARLLVGIDGSQHALRAVQGIVAWRDWLGEVEVHLVYVQPPLTFLETLLPPHRDVIEQWSTRGGEEAARAARETLGAAGIAHHLHLTVGDAATELALLADQAKVDLMVLGTRGKGAAHHAFVGSVALKAAARSRVPVVLVK
jgi:nucleotide-binding universal stress UspA family protein